MIYARWGNNLIFYYYFIVICLNLFCHSLYAPFNGERLKVAAVIMKDN